MNDRSIFVTGGTGYLGRATLPRLLERSYEVRSLTRGAAVVLGSVAVAGNALDSSSVTEALGDSATVLHLVGVSHPAPWKAADFERVDVGSVQALVAALGAARGTGRRHVVYLSVAQPAPVMRAYVAARARCEALLRGADCRVTFVRPWYVLGPGHRWAALLRPLYALAERVPSMRATARRLGLVTLAQAVAALLFAVEYPPEAERVIDVPAMRGLPPLGTPGAR